MALLVTGKAYALDYRNLTENAIVYDGASRQANPQFILLRGTPVEVIVAVEKWAKIREVGGGLGWVDKAQLGDAKQVIVTQASAAVRQQADDASPLVFSVGKDVLLEVQEKPSKAWVKVKHRDGQTGYISIKAVWGI
jgi:SH3-like domain-containing protein